MDTGASVRPERRAVAWLIGVAGIVAVGAVDYHTGSEIRVFPLYYAPLAVMAWHAGRSGALAGTILSAASWLASNVAVGLEYSSPSMWFVNVVTQTASFATVAFLIAYIRSALVHERGLTRTDPLTGLLNRVGFDEEATRLLAFCSRKERPITVAFIDLDDFKAVNDRFGHDVGDDLLRTVARTLSVSIRPSDIAARLGGDEFVVFLPDTGAPEGAAALERLRASLEDALASAPRPVTSSIGGVTFEEVPARVDEVVSLADGWMYKAKQRGRNRVALGIVGRSS